MASQSLQRELGAQTGRAEKQAAQSNISMLQSRLQALEQQLSDQSCQYKVSLCFLFVHGCLACLADAVKRCNLTPIAYPVYVAHRQQGRSYASEVSATCTQAMEDRLGSRTEQLASAESRAADAEKRHSLCHQERDEAQQRFDL